MNPFFRILKYILNYKIIVVSAILCSLVYASMNGFSVYLIGPFLNTLFGNEKVLEESIQKNEEIGGLDRIELYFKEKVDGFLGSGTSRQILTRLCLLIIIVILLKNIFSYLQGYIMAYVIDYLYGISRRKKLGN